MTDTPNTSSAMRDTVNGLIDAYGADLNRWPKEARAKIEVLLSSSQEAQRALAQAQALESRIAAPRPVTDMARLDALQSRVMAAVQDEQHATQRVVTLADARQARAASQRAHAKPDVLINWRAGLALAASLVLGVVIGLSDGPGPLSAESFAELWSGSNDEIALSEDAIVADLEDYL